MTARPEPVAQPSPVESHEIPRERRIFVNRSLRLDKIELIGFDMDWTLAVYRAEPIERLAIECTLRKLVENQGYPAEIRRLDYDPRFAVRGLCVDRLHGNVFKMDRHGHVGRVFHGRRPLSKDERAELYRTASIRLRPPRYAWIDSLFALPEGTIYARLVDYLDTQRAGVAAAASGPNYDRLWQDVRACIDEAHRDESMKGVIKRRLGEFVVRNPDLPATLHKFRSAGRRLFLLTNSEWSYTDAVMRHLLGSGQGNYPTWRHYFDLVLVGSQKPRFFTDRAPFVEIDEQGRTLGEAKALQRGHLYQGGNLADFEAWASARGDRVLYVGDHIYGDMLRSKKSSAWRTALVVEELEDEMRLADELRDRIERLERFERERARLDAEVNDHQLRLKALQKAAEETPSVEAESAKRAEKERLDGLRGALRDCVAATDALEIELDRAFHPWWGSIFKEGNENSKFGEQVEDYACVYTSRVTNFLGYSPTAYLRAPRDYMVHER